MKSLAILALVLTLVVNSSAVRILAKEIEDPNNQHLVEKKLLEDTVKARGTMEYGANSVDSHHNIPRYQYNPRTGGTTEQPPEGDDDNGGGDTNKLLA